jgi:potassium-transporting ATPase ATP-binding subunit
MRGLTDMIKNEGNNRNTLTQDQKEIRRAARARPLLDKKIISFSLKQSMIRLNPRIQLRNPVMFVVEVGAILVSLVFLFNLFTGHVLLFPIQIAIWLWFTVIFANVAEAMAEGRGKAQAESLRQMKVDTQAKLLDKNGEIKILKATDLRKGDIVLVTAGDIIPADGTVVEGVASIDESAITGESAPVIRESGGDRSGVTGGTRVLSDCIQVKVSVNPHGSNGRFS